MRHTHQKMTSLKDARVRVYVITHNDDDKPETCISVSPYFKALEGIFGAVMLLYEKSIII